MSKRYTGNFISGTPQVPTLTSNNGIFDIKDVYTATNNNAWQEPDGYYEIGRSLRFRSSASAYLSRTPASASNRTTWTWSGWAKRGDLSRSQGLFGSGVLGNNANFQAYWNSDNTIYFQETVQNVSNQLIWTSTPVFRDVSAWYHVVIAMDTTQSGAGNRAKVYVNGVQVAGSYSVTPSQNQTTSINNNVAHYVGAAPTNTSSLLYMGGYLTEINFIDGQQLDPTYFGYNDPVTNIWQPKPYSGAYGTNGYYLNFSDNSAATATTIGKDSSGNGNNWTPNNISVTAGTTYDSMVDSPTNIGDADTGAGGQVRGNYAVLNPLDAASAPSDGNLKLVSGGANYGVRSTIQLPASDKWYAECTLGTTTSASVGEEFGFATASASLTGTPQSSGKYGIYADSSGYIYSNGTTITSSLGTFSSGTVLQIAYNGATGDAWVGKNNVWYNSSGGTTGNPATGANPTFTSLSSVFAYVQGVNGTQYFNAGQTAFSYTAPSGFKSLNTANIQALGSSAVGTAAPQRWFDIALYTGRGGKPQSINGVAFQPDLIWIKARNSAVNHRLFDSVRGTNSELYSSATSAETGVSSSLTDFLSNGFSLGTDTGNNATGVYYSSWMWKAGAAAVTNTSGTISSQVSANTSAGFSVVTYTGTGANGTVGHGLGVAPSMIIIKSRDNAGGARDWYVYNSVIGNTKFLQLNTTIAATADSGTLWNSTSPTSSVFSLNTSGGVNYSTGTYVAYCFAAISGYSAFGSYTGNGSTDGPFVYCGFRLRWLMIKRSSSASVTYGWQMYDTSRQPYNTASSDPNLWADTSAAEGTGNYTFDLLSNGFKLRSSGVNENASGDTYIYAAFAENPFTLSRAR